MAVISLPYRYLERLTGADRKTIIERIPMIGSDIERVMDDHADIEFFPARPDLFSVEGVARAMRGFLGIETGLPHYRISPSGISFSVDPGLASIRPYLGSAVIRGLCFDEESILSLMGLQEALHWAVGRGRAKVAIGVHDLDTVTPPFRYIAAPRDRAFVPLEFTESLTMEEILDRHPKGRSYAHLVRNFPRYPLIIDSRDEVLSFPPIINGDLTKVTEKTRNILLDTTGTDMRAVMTAVNIICTALAETGASIESVVIDGTPVPTLAPAERTISARECASLLGISLEPADMVPLLERMRYGAEPVGGEDQVRVQIPCYRADIMHDWDVFEDVAIAHGFDRFNADLPGTFTVGAEHQVGALLKAVRQIFTGLGFSEAIPFTLTNEDILAGRMQRTLHPWTLHVLHPISEEQTVVRTDILPLVLEILELNRHRELPQRIFAAGDTIEGIATVQKAACVSIHPGADFSEAYTTADVICRELGISYTVRESDDRAFIEGRRGDILAGNRAIGVFGEIHPRVLTAFGLEHPVAAVEIDLRAVPGYSALPGTPSPGGR